MRDANAHLHEAVPLLHQTRLDFWDAFYAQEAGGSK
jgi:hypothetical protein